MKLRTQKKTTKLNYLSRLYFNKQNSPRALTITLKEQTNYLQLFQEIKKNLRYKEVSQLTLNFEHLTLLSSLEKSCSLISIIFKFAASKVQTIKLTFRKVTFTITEIFAYYEIISHLDQKIQPSRNSRFRKLELLFSGSTFDYKTDGLTSNLNLKNLKFLSMEFKNCDFFRQDSINFLLKMYKLDSLEGFNAIFFQCTFPNPSTLTAISNIEFSTTLQKFYLVFIECYYWQKEVKKCLKLENNCLNTLDLLFKPAQFLETLELELPINLENETSQEISQPQELTNLANLKTLRLSLTHPKDEVEAIDPFPLAYHLKKLVNVRTLEIGFSTSIIISENFLKGIIKSFNEMPHLSVLKLDFNLKLTVETTKLLADNISKYISLEQLALPFIVPKDIRNVNVSEILKNLKQLTTLSIKK